MYFIIFDSYAPIAVFTACVIAGAALFAVVFGAVFGKKIKHSYAKFAALFYAIAVVCLILLPVGNVSNGIITISRPENNLNFTFDLLRPFSHPVFLRDFLLNFVMLAPLGVFLGVAFRKRFWVNVLVLIVFSAALEGVQYFSVSRVTDVNDFVYNLFGGVLGLIFTKILLPPS